MSQQFMGRKKKVDTFFLVKEQNLSKEEIRVTQLLNLLDIEEHSHAISFLCIIRQLELALKESVGKGLLNDIKEDLMFNYITYTIKVQKS